LILRFEGDPLELRVLLREQFNPLIVHRGTPAAGAALEDFATELPDVDAYADDLAHKIGIAELERRREQLAAEVEVLEARAAAAKPIVEAQTVIDKAADLWRDVDRSARALTLALNEDAAGDIAAKRESHLLRAIRVLGDHLGEEGGEEEESPATATLRDA
jgi:hypothetical protein